MKAKPSYSGTDYSVIIWSLPLLPRLTYDHLFRSYQHPRLLLTVPLLTDLDQRLFQVLLQLVHEKDRHRLCMGNWNSYQITQLDHVVQPTDSVQALSYSPLTLSKHLWSIGLTPSMLLATVSGSASGVKRDNDISISWTPAHTAADTPLAGSNLPTRRAGWNQLYRTPLSNWPTRRAGWTYPYQFPSVTRS